MNSFVNEDVKLGVVGCGKMASAILAGIAKNKFLNSEDIFVYDTNIEASGNLCREFGFQEAYSIENLVQNCDIILIATKPFVVSQVLLDLKDLGFDKLLLSVAAGVRIKKYTSVLENAKVIRIMPNTPALLNEGMSAICGCDNVSDKEIDFAFKLMSCCGKVIKTTEDKIDVITALSGSGPAFYFKIIQLLAQSAAKLGLNKDEALLLSTQTALGSAKMIFENDFNIDKLIKDVTTPGGCTEVGNEVLADSMIADIFDKLIFETMLKAKELG